jgi:L-gulonolactone oxidase
MPAAEPAFRERRDLASWGRLARPVQQVFRPRFRDEIEPWATTSPALRLGVGLRRSYGDVCLSSEARIVETTGLDRIIAFDPQAGTLRAEAGMSLSDIIRLTVPHGLFPATVPGTRNVTLGGAVANDVHGKNHHRAGSFGRSVRRIGLVRSGEGLVEIGPRTHPDLFAATLGGLGLTGLMTTVEIDLVRIPSAWLEVETVPMDGLGDFFRLARESETAFEHSVAWIDCTATGARLGAGLFSRANWAPDGGLTPHPDRAGPALPFDLPAAALDSLTLTAFNRLYAAAGRLRGGRCRRHYSGFFFPLDSITGWNRLYGRRGFYQYQCLLPPATAEAGIRELLEAIAASGQGSFLAVLKTFGSLASPGLLSFPGEGTTLALDFANRGAPTLALLARLDAIVAAGGGRLYPAKDARMPRTLFEAGYPRLDAFRGWVDPAVTSDFWRRMTA